MVATRTPFPVTAKGPASIMRACVNSMFSVLQETSVLSTPCILVADEVDRKLRVITSAR